MHNIENMLEKILSDNKVKVVSFDVFDTILFRTVRKPVDVFKIVADEAKKLGILKKYIDSNIFLEIRIEAEKKAKKKSLCEKKAYDIDLNQIYECMPQNIVDNKREFIELELSIEKEICYINPMVHELVKSIHDNNKKIILISDMYLSKEQILEILEYNEFDISILDDIYVSSDYKNNKFFGDLYKLVLKKMSIEKNEIIHIGDNYYSDIFRANKLGIKTIHYDVISGENFPDLYLEELKYNEIADELYSLRRYVSTLDKEFDKEGSFWFRLGAVILGPLFACATEWILDLAEENEINKIFCLMRDGEFLSKLIIESIKFRNKKIEVKKTYISRQSAMLPALEEINRDVLEEIIGVNNSSICDLFRILKIQEFSDPFKEYLGYKIKDMHNTNIGDKSLYECLIKYLLSDVIRNEINHKISVELELINDYFKSIGLHDRSIIVDIGYNGTLHILIDKILKKNNIRNDNLYLLLIEGFGYLKGIFNNINLQSYVNFNEELLHSFYKNRFIIDLFVTCDKGTTIGYEKKQNKIVPITQLISYPNKKQLKNILTLQKGVLEFQKQYLLLENKKNRIRNLKFRSDDNMKMIIRLLTLPTLEEAKLVGELYYDENYVSNSFSKVCEDKYLDVLKNCNNEEYIYKLNVSDSLWKEGILTKYDPMSCISKIAMHNDKNNYNYRILQLIKRIKQDKINEIAIVGAGELGRRIFKYCSMCEKLKVEAFIDNNKSIQGSKIDNIRILSMKNELRTKNYIIASIAFADKLTVQVINEKGNKINLYYI